MNATMMTITPELAAQWLESSQGNPRFAKKLYDNKKAETIATDIRNGNWHQGSNAICLDSNGHLVEGHHRCEGIVRAGIPVTALVIFGMPPDNQRHIDDNQSRSVAQRLSLKQIVPSIIILQLVLLSECKQDRASSEEIIRYYEEHKDDIDTVVSTLTTLGKRGPASQAGTIHAIYCAYCCGVSPDTLDQFRRVVMDGFSDGIEQSAAIVYRNQYSERPQGSIGWRIQQSKNAQMAIKLFADGTPRRRLFKEKEAYYFDRMQEGQIHAQQNHFAR